MAGQQSVLKLLSEDGSNAREFLKKRRAQAGHNYLKFQVTVLLYHAFPEQGKGGMEWQDAVEKAKQDATKERYAVPEKESSYVKGKRTTWAMAQAHAWLKEQHDPKSHLINALWMFLTPFKSTESAWYKYLVKNSGHGIKKAAIAALKHVDSVGICAYESHQHQSCNLLSANATQRD